MCIDGTINQKTFAEQRWQQNIELRRFPVFFIVPFSVSFLYFPPFLFSPFFATPLTVIDSPPQCYHFRKRPCTNHPSNRRNNTRLWLFISFSFFFFSLPPVILVALSMDFNAECNKLRPREGWERASDGLKARAGGESHFSSLRLRLFLTRLNATLDDDKFTGVAGELIVPRFRTTIYQRYP